MTRVFYADRKKDKHGMGLNLNHLVASENSHPVHAGTSWIDSLGYIFWFLKYWIQLRCYVFFNLLPLAIREGIAGFLGFLFLGFSPTNRSKVTASFQAIFPSISQKRLNRLYLAHCAYMGKLTMDFMNGLPKNVDLPVEKFIEFENLEILDRELTKNRGVIMPVTHLGQLVHVIYAFAKHPKKYPIATVVYTPHIVTYEYTNRSGYDHVYLYASTAYSKIAPYLVQHLKKNHIVILFMDYGTERQLRVPMWEGTYPYLLHTPQSCVSLYLRTNASILPCINVPNGAITHSRLTFIENTSLMQLAETVRSYPAKIAHGELSTMINKLIYPSILQYSHVWEEITDFATTRIADRFAFDEYITLSNVFGAIDKKIAEILENSYEPCRNDKLIFKKLAEYRKEFRSSAEYQEFQQRILYSSLDVDLSMCNSQIEITALLYEFQRICHNFGFGGWSDRINSWIEELITIFYSKERITPGSLE